MGGRQGYTLSDHTRGNPEPRGPGHFPAEEMVDLPLVRAGELAGASVLQALAPGEVDDIRSYGLKQPIVLIPNGVDVQEHPGAAEKAGAIRRRFNSERILLYLGRLHPIKGLDMLLQAWSGLGRARDGWRLAIAGPDAVGHQAQLQTMAGDLGLGDSVAFVGPQHGEDKAAWFLASDFFVLPSRSEGFAMTPLEALSFRRPLLLTTACDFPQARDAGAALEVAPAAAEIRRGLEEALSMTDGQRRSMGEAGYRLVCRQFSLEAIARELAEVCPLDAGRGRSARRARSPIAAPGGCNPGGRTLAYLPRRVSGATQFTPFLTFPFQRRRDFVAPRRADARCRRWEWSHCLWPRLAKGSWSWGAEKSP